MFTGIVESMGKVARLQRRGGGARLEVRAPEVVVELAIGDSVAVNGACVTVTERDDRSFACDLVPETVARTNLGILQVDEDVNLERPMRAGDRFGGHIVQGHVDAVGLVRSRRRVGAQEVMEVTIPFELSRYLAPQGSVCLDGVSLTVVAVDRDRFRVALIPHTLASTVLGQKGQGASVNVEVDVLSKYVERHLAVRAQRPTYATLAEEVAGQRSDHGAEAPAKVAAPPAAAAPSKPARKPAAPPKKKAAATKAPVAAKKRPAVAAKARAKGAASRTKKAAAKSVARKPAAARTARASRSTRAR